MPASPQPVPLTPPAVRRGVALGAVLTGALLVLVLLPPVLEPAWRLALTEALHAVCHQLPERTFHFDGVPMGVCHRCTGIYAGLFVGSLLFPLAAPLDGWLWRNARWLLVGALAPMGLDWLGDAAGVFVNTPLSRVLTGAAFGLGAAYLLVRGLAGLFLSAPPSAASATVTPILRRP